MNNTVVTIVVASLVAIGLLGGIGIVSGNVMGPDTNEPTQAGPGAHMEAVTANGPATWMADHMSGVSMGDQAMHSGQHWTDHAGHHDNGNHHDGDHANHHDDDHFDDHHPDGESHC